MTKFILPFLLSLSIIVSAQKTSDGEFQSYYKSQTCRSYFNKFTLQEKLTTDNVVSYLKKNLANLGDYRTGLKFNYAKESPGGFHYSFIQTFNDVEIYQAEIKVNIDRRNTIFAVFDNSENTSGWSLLTIATAGPESVIALAKNTGTPVLCKRKITDDGREILMAQNELIFERDLKSYANTDTVASGKVFMPDPLTTAQRDYGAPYIDDSDKTSPSLEAQMRLVTFRTTFNGSQFLLQSPYVKISDFSGASIAPATSQTGEFYYNRSQESFEDVNAFYHISTIQNHIQQLGFSCADSLVEVDTHATIDDNSYFLPSGSGGKVFLGTGGVDDAEDADVCVHEYGHFVSASAAPGSNNGLQRESLDEAFGDYLAASYSRSLGSYRDNWVFNWDGHNEFWNGRVMDSNWKYPDDINNSKYHNAQIWSAAVFCLNGIIGRNATDSLILQTHYAYAANISLLDAGVLLMYADTLLTNGKYACPIYQCLFAHGLQPSNPVINCSVGITESDEASLIQYISNASSFSLVNSAGNSYKLQLIDAIGQQIMRVDKNQPLFTYDNTNLPAGVYLITVEINGKTKTYKWAKAN